MAAQYETITLTDMDAVLTVRGFKQDNSAPGYEYAYRKEMHKDGVMYYIRVFTSIDKGTNISRSVGSDAIRIVIYNDKGYVVGHETRVNRSTGWAIRLNARIDKWIESVMWCPQCGHPLRERTGKYGKFRGCTTFPVCGYTEPIHEKRL